MNPEEKHALLYSEADNNSCFIMHKVYVCCTGGMTVYFNCGNPFIDVMIIDLIHWKLLLWFLKHIQVQEITNISVLTDN
jgi:hypothetical protein